MSQPGRVEEAPQQLEVGCGKARHPVPKQQPHSRPSSHAGAGGLEGGRASASSTPFGGMHTQHSHGGVSVHPEHSLPAAWAARHPPEIVHPVHSYWVSFITGQLPVGGDAAATFTRTASETRISIRIDFVLVVVIEMGRCGWGL